MGVACTAGNVIASIIRVAMALPVERDSITVCLNDYK
jgi:hypothetical protein